MKNEIILFENQNVKLEVNMQDETVWLTANQMAVLFDKDEKTIRKHINNVFSVGELEKENNTQKMRVVGVKQLVPFYNLDVIISVGYRVNSQNGVIFRRWANKVLKDYMIKGYAVNQKRLDYLEKTVKLIDIVNRGAERLTGDETKEIVQVIGEYSKALDLKIITYEECMSVIDKLWFNNESNLFALERNNSFKSIINDIYQSFGGVDVYESIEEKAANLLYLTVKNHAFIDGNKRIAATIFIYFLQVNGILYNEEKQVIDNNTLASITLLIAESNPKEKEVMIDLIMNFLK